MKISRDETPLPAFEGFSKEAFQFFKDLSENNEKAWFDEHKPVYERAVRGPVASLVQELSERLEEEGLPLRGDAKRSLFRINRDVRFSRDKSPYKTHAGVALTRNFDKHAPGVLYFHLDPLHTFVAAGFYQCEPAVLGQMRTAVCERAAEWVEMERKLTEQKLPLQMEGALIRLPRGFEDAPAEVNHVLKLKSWIVRGELASKSVQSASLMDDLTEFAVAAAPLLRFGWSAIDGK